MTEGFVEGAERGREIVLARHAETRLNVEQRLRGRSDPPLSETGMRQAETLAIAFDAAPPAVVMTSPRRRALETAVAIARRHRVAVSVDKRLDDVDYGAWTGLGARELRLEWPQLFDQYLHDPAAVTFPAGETLLGAQQRAGALVDQLAATDRLDRIAVVTHDAIIRLLVCRVLDAPLAAIRHIAIDLVSTTGLGVRGRAPMIDWINARPDHGQHPR